MALRVDMTGNSTGFQQMLRKARLEVKEFTTQVNEEASRSFRDIGKSFIGSFAGIFTYEGLKQGLTWFIDTGNQIKDISGQLGMSTDEWQKWSDAVGQAGLQTEGFARVVESIKQKRTEALTDPKARAMLSQLGFSDMDISGSMSTSDFVRKAMENSNRGPYAKQAFDTIAGVEGVRYTRALDYLPQSQAVFSPEDIAASQEAQKALHNLSIAAEKAGFSLLAYIKGAFSGKNIAILADFIQGKSVAQGAKDARAAMMADRGEYHPVHAARNGVALTDEQIAIIAKDKKGIGAHDLDKEFAGKTVLGPPDPTNDPMYAVWQQQQHEIAMRDMTRSHQELESQRDLMTIGDRRRSILNEMGSLQDQVSQHEKALSTPEGFLTDAQRNALTGVNGIARAIQVNELREKYKDELSGLHVTLNKDQSELRQQPLQFQADNLAKVGLYSASALRFNPVLGLQQETNTLLRQVVVNTAKPSITPPNDPHRP